MANGDRMGEREAEFVDAHGLLRREYLDNGLEMGPHVQYRAVRPFMVDGVAYRPPGVAGRRASPAGMMITYRTDAPGMCGGMHWRPPQCPTALALWDGVRPSP
jgi:hypothetical protein